MIPPMHAVDLSTRRTPELLALPHRSGKASRRNGRTDEAGDVLGYAVIQRSQKTLIRSGKCPARCRNRAGAAATAQVAMPDEQVRISWPVNTPLAALARQLGSQTVPGGQWLVRIPEMASFLKKMGPLFEQRLADSDWHGLSAQITINLFRQAFGLHFEAGQLVAVDALGFVDASMGADGGHFCIPSDAFLRLLFGYRSLG